MRCLVGRAPFAEPFGPKGRRWLAELDLAEEERKSVESALRQIEFLDSEIEAVEPPGRTPRRTMERRSDVDVALTRPSLIAHLGYGVTVGLTRPSRPSAHVELRTALPTLVERSPVGYLRLPWVQGRRCLPHGGEGQGQRPGHREVEQCSERRSERVVSGLSSCRSLQPSG